MSALSVSTRSLSCSMEPVPTSASSRESLKEPPSESCVESSCADCWSMLKLPSLYRGEVGVASLAGFELPSPMLSWEPRRFR